LPNSKCRVTNYGVRLRISFGMASMSCGLRIKTFVLSHGITKEDAVPGVEIDPAIDRKKRFEADPKAHTYTPGR
jgi:hypothetical protein